MKHNPKFSLCPGDLILTRFYLWAGRYVPHKVIVSSPNKSYDIRLFTVLHNFKAEAPPSYPAEIETLEGKLIIIYDTDIIEVFKC
jgi:hypothetical protein